MKAKLSLEEMNIIEQNYQKKFDLAMEEYDEVYDDVVALEAYIAFFENEEKPSMESIEAMAPYLQRARLAMIKYGEWNVSFEDDYGTDPSYIMTGQERILNGIKKGVSKLWEKTGKPVSEYVSNKAKEGAEYVKTKAKEGAAKAWEFSKDRIAAATRALAKATRSLGTIVAEKFKDLYYDLKTIKFDKLLFMKGMLDEHKFMKREGFIKTKYLNPLRFPIALGHELDENNSSSNVKVLKEVCGLPYELVVKDKVFRTAIESVTKNLQGKKFEEKMMDKIQPTLDIFANAREDLKEFINDKTVFAMPDRLFGVRVRVMRIDQEEGKGTTVTNKAFEFRDKILSKESDEEDTPEEEVEKKPKGLTIPTFTLDECRELTKFATDLLKHNSELEYDELKSIKFSVKASMKGNMLKTLTRSPLAFKNYMSFTKGISHLVLGVKRSHLQAINLIETLVAQSVKKA